MFHHVLSNDTTEYIVHWFGGPLFWSKSDITVSSTLFHFQLEHELKQAYSTVLWYMSDEKYRHDELTCHLTYNHDSLDD